jgi:hypothetical protein
MQNDYADFYIFLIKMQLPDFFSTSPPHAVHNPFLFIRGLSCSSSVQSLLTQNCPTLISLQLSFCIFW